MSISISSITQKISFDNIEYRCPQCFLIPFINISTIKNKNFMSIKCINNHNYLKPFDEMQIMCKLNPKSFYFCTTCESESKKNISNILYYCPNCYKFFCLKHAEMHKLKDEHKIIFNKNYDNNCFEHNGNTFIGYCSNHNKNYCLRCNHFIENNKKIDEELTEEQINYYENEIKKNEEIIKDIAKIFNNYKK